MSPKIPLEVFDQLLRFSPALRAFDQGDVDLARRSLIASFRHHTRRTLTVSEEISMLWCLVWFYFYEGRTDQSEKCVREIISIEERLANPRPNNLIYAQYVLALVCHSQGKLGEASNKLTYALSQIEKSLGKNSRAYLSVSSTFQAA